MFSIRAQWWKVYFVIGCLSLGLYITRPSAVLETSLVLAYGLTAAVAIFYGVWHYHPRPLLAWFLLGLGQACITIGDLIFDHAVYLGKSIVPFDLRIWFYVFALVCLLIGVLILSWSFRRLITRDALINGLVVAVGLGVIVWLFHIAPYLSTAMGWLQWLDRLALPLLLMVVLTNVSILLMTPLGSQWSWRFMVIAIGFYIVGTSFYNQIVARAGHGFASLGSIVYLNDAFFSATYLMVGMALVHPSVASFRGLVSPRSGVVTRFERNVLGACILIIPATFTVLHVTGRAIDDLFTVISMGMTSLLVLWRLNRMADVLESQNRQLKKQKDRLSYQAHTDALTTLPNRFFLYQYLSEVVERACRSGQQGAVLMIDLNRFKEMNDTFGHDVGDRTLKEIANQFVRQKRKTDVVARWGGDEFIYILEDVENEDNVLTFARRLHNEVSYAVEMQGQAVSISLSIGICLFPLSGSDVHTIVKNSDIALYQAKKCDGEKISLYNQ